MPTLNSLKPHSNIQALHHGKSGYLKPKSAWSWQSSHSAAPSTATIAMTVTNAAATSVRAVAVPAALADVRGPSATGRGRSVAAMATVRTVRRAVLALIARDLDPALPAMKAVGVREIAAWLAGKALREEAVAALQQATRNYAKRQLTWFRNHCRDWARV